MTPCEELERQLLDLENGSDSLEQGIRAYKQGDDTRAVCCFHKAVARGDVGGEVALGLMYEYGRGVPKSDSDAVDCTKRAANQGHPSACWSLAWRYFDGRGVSEDAVKAYVWCRRAASSPQGWWAENNVDDACQFMGCGLDPSQRDEAQRLEREWDAAHLREP